MRIHFHEIKDEDLHYEFNEKTPWVMDIVGALDERADGIRRPPGWRPPSRETSVTFDIRKIDDLIHVQGKVKTKVYLLCSLCADAFQFPIDTPFNVLFTTNTIYSDTPRESSRRGATFDWGGAPHDDLGTSDDDFEEDSDLGPAMSMNPNDYEVTVVKEPVMDLKEILNEQMVLLIPMQPKPPVNDDGDCQKCGKDQVKVSEGLQVAPLKENPFAALKTFKATGKPKS